MSDLVKFTDRQNSIVAAAITLFAGVGSLFVVMFILRRVFAFIGAHDMVLLPPVVASILAMLLRPPFEFLRRHLRNSNTAALFMLSVLIVIPLGLFVWYFGRLAVQQLVAFVHYVPQLIVQANAWLGEKLPDLAALLEKYNISVPDFDDYIGQLLSAVPTSAASVGRTAYGFATRFLAWCLLPIYTVIFLATRPLDERHVERVLAFTSPKTRRNVTLIVRFFIDAVVNFFRGQVLVALLLGVFYSIAYWVVGLPYGFAIGLLQGLLNVVPYLGNFIGICTIVPVALCSGETSAALLVRALAVFIAGQIVDGYLITPRVMGNRMKLNAFVVIFSIFFWNAVIGGMLGIVLAIPLSASLAAVWELLRREYFHQENIKDSQAP